jgi:sugar/nucleoside kinase (ribokinase family)
LPSLPVLGQELVATNFNMVLGSSSAITAVRLAALGAEVRFTGWLGDDAYGQFILREFSKAGINCDGIQIVSTATGVTIALTFRQDRALLTYPGTIAAFDGRDIGSADLKDFAHLHVGSFFLQSALQPQLAALFQMAHDQGLTTSLDPGWDPAERWADNPYLWPTLAHTDYFLPNLDEATALTGGEDQPERLAQRFQGTLVVKRGADGARAYDRRGLIASAAAFNVEVVDTTGAGDAFNAGFLYARCLEQAALDAALRFGTACGADAVTHLGGATDAPNAPAIHAMLQQRTDT